MISHIEVFDADGSALPDWRATVAKVKRNPEVLDAAPFIASQALLARGDDAARRAGARHRARRGGDASPNWPPSCSDTALGSLQPGAWRIVLGIELARQLGVRRKATT